MALYHWGNKATMFEKQWVKTCVELNEWDII